MTALALRTMQHSTALTDALDERKPDRRTELADLYDEIAALRATLAYEGRCDDVYSRTLWHAIWNERWDLVRDVAKTLRHKSGRLTAQGTN